MTSVKTLIWGLFLSIALPVTSAPLSEVDRQLIMEKLEEIQKAAEGNSLSKLEVALKAFRSAAVSDAEAHDLYLKCIERVRFEDQNRKSQEFREWKRSHRENGDTAALRTALRHQLNWLVLYLQAASQPEDIASLGPRALAQLNSIMEEAGELQPQRGILGSPVSGSVFAKAYEVDNLKSEDFPSNPLDLSGIYDKVILPPLRRTSRIEDLRKAWTTRLTQEGKLKEEWGRESSISNEPSADFEKWLEGERHEIVWDMHVDLFKIGDERASAMALLDHLQKNAGHNKFDKWVEEFASLIAPSASELIPEEEPSRDLAPE